MGIVFPARYLSLKYNLFDQIIAFVLHIYIYIQSLNRVMVLNSLGNGERVCIVNHVESGEWVELKIG